MKIPVKFSGSMTKNADNKSPDILCSFLKWLLCGDRELNENLDSKTKVQSETISATIMYNMKSNRQTTYAQNIVGPTFNRRRYTPLHQICMGLSLRHLITTM